MVDNEKVFACIQDLVTNDGDDKLSRMTFIQLGGLAAVLAGLLRGIGSLVPVNARGVLPLYFVTDLFILLGSIGLYAFLREASALPGLFGFLLEIIGIAILMSRELGIFGDAAYPVGALLFAAGLDLLAVASWKTAEIPRWMLFFWVLSTVIGLIGFFSDRLNFLFVASGLMFSFSFAAAGLRILAGQSKAPDSDASAQ